MNKHEIKAYEQAIAKYNPFHGVNFPITSVKLCEIINGLREKHNEKVVELRHDHLMAKIAEFSGPNFRVAESEYLDDQKKPRKCYLLGKLECRVLASNESKTINVLIMTYLEQLELIFEEAKERKATVFDNKLAKNGIPWREACKAAGIHHPDLAKQYMVKRGLFTYVCNNEFPNGTYKLSKAVLDQRLFKYVETQGRNLEGFRVLTEGYKRLCESAESINWKCLKYSQSPKHKATYEKHFAKYKEEHPEEFDTFGVWLKPQW